MDQLRAMQVFACVADQGSFAGAARALDLAPAVVSRLVAELETGVGARLLTRTTRRVALTQIGQRYLERVQGILRDVEEAGAAVRASQGRLSGRVRILAPPVFAAHQLTPRLPRLHQRHPQVLVEVTASGPVEAVHEGFDISIVARQGPLDGGMVAHRLLCEEVILCAAPAYLQVAGRPQRPPELERHALLLAVPHGLPRSATLLRAGPAGGERCEVLVPPDRVLLSTHNGELAHAGVLAAMGIAAMPLFAVHDDLRAGLLERVLPEWRLPSLSIYACLPSRRQVPAVVRAMLDFLRAEFPDAEGEPAAGRSAPPYLRRVA